MVQLITVLILISISMGANSSPVYNPGALGEKDFVIYNGDDWPLYEIDPYTNNLIWNDDKIKKKKISNLWGKNTDELEFFFENHFLQSINCPHDKMSETFEYLRYANRLIAISYLFDSIKSHEQVVKKMGIKGNICKVNWKKAFKMCEGKTKYMNSFLNNINVILDQLSEFVVSADLSQKSFTTKWLEEFQGKDFQDVTQYRLQAYCNKNYCSSINKSNIANYLENICQQDQELIKTICSEKDSLYGMFQITEVFQLLQNSSLLDSMNSEGNAKGCLKRFAIQLRKKEKKYKALEAIFPILYTKYTEDQKNPYPQGRLFAAGELLEYTNKGLTSVFESKKEKAKIVASTAPVEKIVEISKVKKIETKNQNPPKVVVKQQVEKKVLPKEDLIWKSSFLIATDFRQKYDLEIVKVDMLKFKYDYFFNLKISKVMDKALSSYMKLEALSEMKKYDQLGTKKGAVPLVFVKYMIEQGHHQGLFNLISVLGNSFYVRNTIDKNLTDDSDYIEIKNDKTTNFQWQIYVRRPPNT